MKYIKFILFTKQQPPGSLIAEEESEEGNLKVIHGDSGTFFRVPQTIINNTYIFSGLSKRFLSVLLQVLQLLSQLRKEFNVSRDEQVLPLLERFHHGHRLVLQLLEESLKGMAKMKVPTITRTVASGSESGDVSEDGSDVFDTVTQLDETGNTVTGQPSL